ncbi:hypothetical protein MH117_04995 [Paenibacillus sp. ACRRX]|uniref:hypothetical protein n=1 Tax=Paenibacillus sp. ACRRX TaxID=2918206 RepID=UPI001EF43A28|nr:hypothetical protein [Paenibacillus sp. ACRRX]MCG7406767.1 hypothetical protein [Paenibacillus sp. ACRRX]
MDWKCNFADATEIEEFCKMENNIMEIYSLCRSLYLTAYDGLKRDEDGYGMYISDEKILILGKSVKRISKDVSEVCRIEESKAYEQLLIVLKNNYVGTATRKEIESRSYVERDYSDSFRYGTHYNFNEIPNWGDFLNRMNQLISSEHLS